MTEAFEFDVFMCYSRSNARWGKRLAGDLEDLGVRVWIDTMEITVGDVFRRKIVQAIQKCRYFCLVISPQSMKSYYVRSFEMEWAFALMSSTKRESFILPVILKHPPEGLPLELRQYQYLDFSRARGYYENLLGLARKVKTSQHGEDGIAETRSVLSQLTILQQKLGTLTDPGEREATQAAIVALEESVEDVLERQLPHLLSPQDPQLCRIVLDLLGLQGAGESVAAHLGPMLEHPSPYVWTAAARALGQIGGSSTAVMLLNLLNNSRTPARRRFVYALGLLGADEAVGPLIDLLGGPSGDAVVRRSAVSALGEIGHKSALRPLLLQVDSEDVDTQTRALLALGQLGTNLACEPLVKVMLDSRRPEIVRTCAALALGQLHSGEAIPALRSIVDEEYDEREVRPLRWGATYALGMIPPTLESVGLLLQSLEDGDRQVRWLACVAAQGLCALSAGDALLKRLLCDHDTGIQRQALYSLTALADNGLLIALENAGGRIADPELKKGVEALMKTRASKQPNEAPKITFPRCGSVVPENPLEIRGEALVPLSTLGVFIHTDMDWPQDGGVLRWHDREWRLDECYFGGVYSFAIHYVHAIETDQHGLGRRSNVIFCRGADISAWDG